MWDPPCVSPAPLKGTSLPTSCAICVSICPMISQVGSDGSRDSAEPGGGFAVSKGDPRMATWTDKFSASITESLEDWLRDGHMGWVWAHLAPRPHDLWTYTWAIGVPASFPVWTPAVWFSWLKGWLWQIQEPTTFWKSSWSPAGNLQWHQRPEPAQPATDQFLHQQTQILTEKSNADSCADPRRVFWLGVALQMAIF